MRDERTWGTDVTFRPAHTGDCRRIAELFRISSGGVADYIWSHLDHPDLTPIEIGELRYRRENTAFSYQNCLVAERAGHVIGMIHAFPIMPRHADGDDEAVDPVLRPYMELEIPDSLYVAGLALYPDFRGRALGSRMLQMARNQARRAALGSLSLLVFEQNAGAVSLYERHGFRVVDRRRVVPHALIGYGGDVLLMEARVLGLRSAE